MASIARRPDGTYRPRFRDATGKEHARHFKRKVDAQRWLDEMTAAMVTGQYVDPAAGRMTFREYAERWRATQVHRPTTAAHVETMLRRHVYPALGDKRLGSVLPSDVQSLVKQLSLAPRPGDRRSGPPDPRRDLQGRRPRPPDRGLAVRGHQAAEGPPSSRSNRMTARSGRGADRGDAGALPGVGHPRRGHRAAAGRGLRSHCRPDRLPAPAADRRPPARHHARPGALPRAAQDAGVRPGRPAPPGRRRRPRGPPATWPADGVRLHHRAAATPIRRTAFSEPRLAAGARSGPASRWRHHPRACGTSTRACSSGTASR